MGDCPGHCRILGSIPDLPLLDATRTPQMSPDMDKCLLGAKSALVGSLCPRFTKNIYSCRIFQVFRELVNVLIFRDPLFALSFNFKNLQMEKYILQEYGNNFKCLRNIFNHFIFPSQGRHTEYINLMLIIDLAISMFTNLYFQS